MGAFRCENCDYMKLTSRAVSNGNNLGLAGARAGCQCNHPKADELFNKICPRSPRTPGFIGFTTPGGITPQIKTAPRWCPKKQEEPK